jgi:hypothetical protein
MRAVSCSAISLTLAFSLWSSTAMAAATEEGAASLLANLQTYLGTTEGVLAVAVDGDAYKVTFDASPLMAKAEGMTATMTPLQVTVTDNGDGTWAYGIDQPVSLNYAVPDLMSSKTDYGSLKVTGLWDEALGDSRSYQIDVTDLRSEQVQKDPELGDIPVTMTQGSLTFAGSAEKGASGVDAQFVTTSADISYEMTIPGSEGMPAMPISGTVGAGSADGTMTGYQPKALYGLLAFFVAHPTEALIEGDQPGLKAALETAMPIFENLTLKGVYKDIAINTPMGPVGMAEAGLDLDANGVVADGKFREAIRIKGLTLPEMLVPPFAAPLVPSDVSIDVTATRFNPAAAATLALGLLDLPIGTPAPEGFDAQMLSALLPEGVVDVTIAPGETNSPIYKLTYEGALSVGPATPMPVGKARIGLTGMEKISETLMASPPEMGMQEMAPMLGIAQMMAQPGADGELIWDLEITETGGFLVNGQDMMGGGQ